MCGSTRSTISPSSSRTRRSTPWAAGCCGPKLMLNCLSSVSGMVLRGQTLRVCPLSPTVVVPWGQTCRVCPLLRSLLVARDDVLHALPGAHEIEAPEFLRQLHRLVDHPLLGVVVPDLHIPCQRE